MQVYTVSQMREAERRTETEYGIPLAVLMANAGKGLARAALEMLPQPDSVIAIFCGNGNNGGDGYVCVTELLRQRKPVAVWGIGAEGLPAGSLVKSAADAYLAAGGVILPVSPDFKAEDLKCGLIVDALLGTGLGRPVSGLYAQVIRSVNAASIPVLSCDLPSGVDADTGQSIRGDRLRYFQRGGGRNRPFGQCFRRPDSPFQGRHLKSRPFCLRSGHAICQFLVNMHHFMNVI